ncbi:MAG TPA: DinB family protein [Candidatus Stackebrandtia faecavium]|nr:DinB family protein [Candidatus Stackebrandtia faecavium]
MSLAYYETDVPIAGTETEALHGALNRLRTTFRWKTDGLTSEGLNARIGASTLTLGGLLKHLAICETLTFDFRLKGDALNPRWDGGKLLADFDLSFDTSDMEPGELYRVYDESVAESISRFDATVTRGGLDQEVHLATPDGVHRNLRGLVCDLIEEYGRHTGHADLLREAVDGRVGEDAPEGWRPVGVPKA